MHDLTINTDIARQILVSFIRSEVTRVGYTRAVVGLSGGIDSALSCALAAEALGKDNVLAVRMPYKSSSPDSLTHAELLIERGRRSARRAVCSRPGSSRPRRSSSCRSMRSAEAAAS